jgi:hypothetical protein
MEKFKDEVKKIFDPFAQRIYDSVTGGFNDYLVNDSKNGHIHNSTTKSNLIGSYVIKRLRNLVVENPESMRWSERRRMMTIIINDKIRCRFKKLDKNLKTSNIMTGQVKAFKNHELPIDKKPLICVDIGWKLDLFFTEILEVFLVCPENERKDSWRISFAELTVNKGQVKVFEEKQDETFVVARVKESAKPNTNAETGS